MCERCNYVDLLTSSRLSASENRLRVLEIIGGNKFPLSAADIYQILERRFSINRVTVYRILDLLVDHGVVERISTGGRAFYYGLAPNEHHRQPDMESAIAGLVGLKSDLQKGYGVCQNKVIISMPKDFDAPPASHLNRQNPSLKT